MNHIIALLLSTVMFCNIALAKPWKLTEKHLKPINPIMIAQLGKTVPYTGDSQSPSVFKWEPELMPEVDLGEIKLQVWFLNDHVPAPIAGYLLTENDWKSVRRIIKSVDGELQAAKDKERKICADAAAIAAQQCKDLNEQLIQQLEDAKTLKASNEKLIDSKDDQLFWLKIGLGVSVGITTGTFIYHGVK